ncbi:hypothetical protein ACVNS2_16760 [Paenibacillus caseinilyticus]|uniref:Uncharacterized protein n=1 Tax=Paenibacillus mucilaginosus K02 TaxID=997761 RepID=I0BIV2_9BACL|nr:hypothetical protein [Paenibacillus mucilaginosus]AFH62299.1 hypothetical protein B2K_16485 [Paenibacillus mucilaginosus K02]
MIISIKTDSLRKATKKQKMFIQLNASLDMSSTMMNLYLGEAANRPELQPFEKIYTLAFSLGNLAEALKRFEEIVKDGIMTIKDAGKDNESDWHYINSSESLEIKQLLFRIRDQLVFHVDYRTLRSYLEETNEVEVDILEVSEEERLGVSQLSFNIIAHNLQNELKIDEALAVVIGRVMNSLRNLVRSYIVNNFEVTVK